MDTARSIGGYVAGFLAIVSIGDLIGLLGEWRDRRGFSITARIEKRQLGPTYQVRANFALRGSKKQSINSVIPVVRPRWIVWRIVHGGWSAFGTRSRGIVIEATADGGNPTDDLVVDDPAPRQFVFDIGGRTTELPARWSWPWDKRTVSRVPRPREVKLRCSLSGEGVVYIKPRRVEGPLVDPPTSGRITKVQPEGNAERPT